MRHLPLVASALLPLALPAPLSAAPYLSIGVDDRCAQVVTNSDANRAWIDIYGMWAIGFFSGMNRATLGRVGEHSDGMGIWRALYNHCAAHPGDDLSEAAAAVYDRMATRRHDQQRPTSRSAQ